MRKEIGIWLNTSKAVLVNLCDGKKEEIQTLESEVESRTRFAGEKKPFSRLGSLLTNTSSRLTNRRKKQMHDYFAKIMQNIDHNANALFIFGPSAAKKELEKELKKHPDFCRKPVIVESADKMTERQMIAHVKEFFDKKQFNYAKMAH